jgi:hypothetical protein
MKFFSVEIQILVWDRHKNVAGLNGLIELQPFPLDLFVCFDGV